jgi:hypothetical protein
MQLFFVIKTNGKHGEYEDFIEESFVAVDETREEIVKRFTTDYWVEVNASPVIEVDGYIISAHKKGEC